YDGNNVPDILWHYKGNSTGPAANAIWVMNGATISGGIWLPNSPDPNWALAGTGRFHVVNAQNPDQNRDILWRHSSSALTAVWSMNGTTFQSSALLNEDPGATWRIGATADFNEDGYTDILWDDNTTGTKVVWLMKGLQRLQT